MFRVWTFHLLSLFGFENLSRLKLCRSCACCHSSSEFIGTTQDSSGSSRRELTQRPTARQCEDNEKQWRTQPYMECLQWSPLSGLRDLWKMLKDCMRQGWSITLTKQCLLDTRADRHINSSNCYAFHLKWNLDNFKLYISIYI